MANPASFTITELSGHGGVSQPAAQTVDTNGIVPIPAGSDLDRLFIEIVNTDDAALTVTLQAGDYPLAPRSGIGDASVAFTASGGGGDKKLIGPIESGRFAKKGGIVNLQFQAATGAPAASVRVYRLGKA
jgi:hypothetical protein